MKPSFFYIVLLSMLSSYPSFGQNLQTGNTEATPKDFVLKVSQFGQFIKRFNFEEDFKGNEISASFSKKIKRSDYINLLFNKQDKRLDSTSTAYSKNYRKLKDEFIKKVSDKNYKISRISDSLYSVAVCEVSYHGRPATVQLLLKQQVINTGIAWVISDASADFFYDESNCHGSKLFIPPTSNEVNYIHLKRFFNNKDSLACYAYKGYNCNRLSIFFQLLHSGEIQYEHVNTVVYFISDIPGWIVQVREYNRNGDNSGWLIENITRLNEPVQVYLKNTMNSID